MEQSSLISNVIIKLQIAYPSYFNKLSQEESIALAQMYKDELSKYSEGILSSSIKNINIMPRTKYINVTLFFLYLYDVGKNSYIEISIIIPAVIARVILNSCGVIISFKNI